MNRFLLSLLGVLCHLALYSQNTITLQVNMSEQVVSPNGVHVAGSFQGWNPSTTPMQDLGNGIYSVDIDVPDNTEILFKFINGNDWPQQESVPSTCGADDGFGAFNRNYNISSGASTYGPVCFGGCENCGVVVEPSYVDATFIVDMSNQVVSPDGVHIAGSFQGWNPSSTSLNDNGDGTYSITVPVETNSTVQFKFINGIDWPQQETVPSDCGVSDGFGGFNRAIYVLEDNAGYGAVCFSECDECGIVVEPETVQVLFQVNMSNEIVSPQGVHLAGNFQGWNPNATVMTDLGGGNFEILYEVPANTQAQFRFINGSEWINAEIVPSDCGIDNGFGENIRTLDVLDVNTVYGPVCFGECANCTPAVPTMVIFQVDMSNETVSPDGVHVVGNFNDWSLIATEMASNGDGTYQAVAFVNSNSELIYKFVNGIDWQFSEIVPAECGSDDGSGNINRTIAVLNDAVTTPLVCFGSCSECVIVPTVDVTFLVDMSNETVSADGVHIAGDFNDFSPTATPMTFIGGGVYSATVALGQNQQVFYKFINGNDFSFVENVPFECGQNDGFGGYNRSIVTNNSNFTTNPICFSSCEACTVGLNELTSDAIVCYPNPAENTLSIRNAQNGTIQIIDLTGRTLINVQSTPILNLDVSQLPSGLYVIKNEEVVVGTFVKK